MHWIRVVYLYLFALIGLVLVTVGGIQLVNLALRSYVLTEADAEMRMHYYPEPPMRFSSPDRIDALTADTALTPQVREALQDWAADYQRQRELRESIDPVRSRRQRDAARAIAFLLVGVPLFGYHWRRIRKERAGFLPS